MAIGYGVYYFGTNIASDKIVEELENSGQLAEAKQYVENNPELKQFLSEGKMLTQSNYLLQQRKKQHELSLRKVGVSELTTIQAKAQEGSLTKEECFTNTSRELH